MTVSISIVPSILLSKQTKYYFVFLYKGTIILPPTANYANNLRGISLQAAPTWIQLNGACYINPSLPSPVFIINLPSLINLVWFFSIFFFDISVNYLIWSIP